MTNAPSERARGLVVGAYDLHVHVAPDVPERRIDDRTLAQRFGDLGLAGFALKSHYTSTAERAQVVSSVVPDVQVVGTLTLNCAVGGMNALAVEIAAREGAAIVWMPTVDSPAETAGRTAPRDGDKVPQWAQLQHELRGLGLSVDAVHVTDPNGRLLPEARDVLRAIASSTSCVSGRSAPASSVTSTASIEKPSPRNSCWSLAHCGTLSPGFGSVRPAVSAGESTVGIQTISAPSRAAISTASGFIPPTAQLSVIVPNARTPSTAWETICARSAVDV